MTIGRRARAGRAILTLVFLWAGSVCAQEAGRSAIAHPASWPAMPPSPLVKAADESFIDALLVRMSLEEKIGQMVQADIASIAPDDLRHYKLGSILAGGLSAPGGNLQATPGAWRRLVSAYKQAALADVPKSHAAIPILFGIDAVHGNAKLRGATIFPHNIGLGAAHDPDLIRRIGNATAQEVAAIGIDWAFAPTVAVARDMRWGRAYESYSDDPALVAAYASAMVTGLQGELGTADYFAAGHVLASAKHFLGDGGTEAGRDQGDTRASEQALRDVHGAGYRAALSAGVGSVMASYNAWHGVKMHANASLLTGVLKERWHFGGFVVGDWNAQEEIPGCTKFSCAQAVNAGIDMVMAPDGWKEMYDNLLRQTRAGIIPAARIDDAVRRILRVKALAGLIGPDMHRNAAASLGDATLGMPEHRALAREAVQKSLVLLKNESALLPLARSRHVLVVGDAADSLGRQSGGWTVDWQGAHNTNADIAGGTSIFAGIKAVVEQGGGKVEFSAQGVFTRKPDVAIVVFGESPYAEFEGDRENLLLPQGDHVRAVLQRLHAQHIPVVSVLLSGRPLWVNPELNLSDAFVAAWLPGSEGEGIADLLFRPAPGAVAHDFTGRLSFPWPATAMPVTYDGQNTVSGAQFARGYGLDAAHPEHLGPLAEDPGMPAPWNTVNTFYGAGHVIAPWSIYVGDGLGQTRLTGEQQDSPAGAVQATRHGDTLRAAWSGKGEGSLWIGDTQTDLTGQARNGTMLSLTYHLDEAPAAAIRLGVTCGDGCAGWIDATRLLDTAPGWQTLRIPLACFAAHGAQLSHIVAPLAMTTAGRAMITFRDVSLATGVQDGPCPAVQP